VRADARYKEGEGEERGGLRESSGDRKEERRHALRGNDSIIFSIAHALICTFEVNNFCSSPQQRAGTVLVYYIATNSQSIQGGEKNPYKADQRE
jgi:hypothetical protein